MLTRRAMLLALAAAGCVRRAAFTVARAPAGATTLPLQFVGTLPTVPVVVAGRTIDVLLDLGGFDTLSLSPALGRQLARPTGNTRMFRTARGDALVARELVLPDVRIGDVVLHDVRGYEHVFARDFPPPVEAGYLGRGILDRFALAIDYPARSVAIARSRAELAASPGRRWSIVPFSSSDSGAVVSASLDGRMHELLLDTGATSSFMRQPYRARDLRIGGVSLGPLDFEPLDLSVPDADGLLGASFFAPRRVLVDFPAAVIGLEVPD